MSTRQQTFIQTLAARTGAYQDSEGMMVGTRAYPNLDLDAAIDGTASKATASKIIDILLGAPQSRPVASATKPASEKQIAFIESLANRKGRTVETEGITSAQASALIEELKAA